MRFRLTLLVFVSALLCFAQSGVTKVTSVEGITEYRFDQWPQTAGFPGSFEAEHHGKHDLPGGLAA